MQLLGKKMIIVCLCFCTGSTFCQWGTDTVEARKSELRFLLSDDASWVSPNLTPLKQNEKIYGLKKPAVGILLSAVVPGAGEFYVGSWIKGAIFLGVEAALWYGYSRFSDKGQAIEDDFHTFADMHWSEARWVANRSEHDPSTHTLPETKTQQYYEMIGKYDQFKAGWDDYADGGPALTPRRDYYENLRNNSNIEFKRATTCVMLAMGNRLLSVFDTAFTIRSINRRVEAKMRMGVSETQTDRIPCFTIGLSW